MRTGRGVWRGLRCVLEEDVIKWRWFDYSLLFSDMRLRGWCKCVRVYTVKHIYLCYIFKVYKVLWEHHSLSNMYHSFCCCLQSQLSGRLEGHSMSDETKTHRHTQITALITTALKTFFSDRFTHSTLLTRGCLCCVLLLFRAGTEVDRVCFRVMITVYWETLLHCSTAAQEHFRNDQLTYKHTKMHKSKHFLERKWSKNAVILCFLFT